MRGLDGNYLNTQGEMLSRMQVAQQAELVAQQARAQAQSLEALRQLREQVGTSTRSDAQNKSNTVDEKQGGGSRGSEKQKAPRTTRYDPAGGTETEPGLNGGPGVGHVDLRI